MKTVFGDNIANMNANMMEAQKAIANLSHIWRIWTWSKHVYWFRFIHTIYKVDVSVEVNYVTRSQLKIVLKSDLKLQVALHTIRPWLCPKKNFLANFCILLSFCFTKFWKVCFFREISIEFTVCFGANLTKFSEYFPLWWIFDLSNWSFGSLSIHSISQKWNFISLVSSSKTRICSNLLLKIH